MGNPCSVEISGEVQLASHVSLDMLKALFTDAQGEWCLEDGVLSYSFWAEGNRTVRGPDHDAMLNRLVSGGYNLAAWEEFRLFDSEDTGELTSSCVRGTDEQQRLFELRRTDE